MFYDDLGVTTSVLHARVSANNVNNL